MVAPMSYCRWSDDNVQCDLYCFGTGDDYVTYVREHRTVGQATPLPDVKTTPDKEFPAALNRQMEFGMSFEVVPIGLPHDGEIFRDPTLEAFKARLLYLRSVGYRFPDHVLERIDNEMHVRDHPDVQS